jgi:hypothetical protein
MSRLPNFMRVMHTCKKCLCYLYIFYFLGGKPGMHVWEN